ncbi:hypothetical protein QWZ13_10470 [Reinekea marina]|nr:hypothetical protein [Reinekea marina]MDN3649335.1 hypothetical protein [Reinekea marina]
MTIELQVYSCKLLARQTHCITLKGRVSAGFDRSYATLDMKVPTY